MAAEADARDAAGSVQSVEAHMSRSVLAVRDDCSLETAMNTIVASGHRHIVVVDSSGDFEGVLPAEAILRAWMTSLAHRRRVVRDLVPTPPVHLSPSESMHAAASVMLSYFVDAVGVLESDGRLVGILTWADIVAMVAERERA